MRQRKTNLTVGRGRLYFDPFLPGTTTGAGERYIGNTPSFSITRKLEFADKLVSRRGRIELGDRQTIGETVTASFSTDDMNDENVSRWMGLNFEEKYVDPKYSTKTVVAKRGGVVSFGEYPGSSTSAGSIISVAATRGTVPLDIDANFDLSKAQFGQLVIRENAETIIDGDLITVTVLSDIERMAVYTENRDQVRGALHFVSNNAHGDNYEYLFPYVHLTPSGSLDTKTDDFQNLLFDVTARRLNALTPFMYVKRFISSGAKTLYEKQILAIPMSLVSFQLMEDRLNTVTQKTLPSRGY